MKNKEMDEIKQSKSKIIRENKIENEQHAM
jgi:hypothetical protein